MTYIDKNYGPIILGDYIGHQEIYIDKQLNIMNGESSASETFQQTEANGNNGTDGNTGTNDNAETDSNTGRNGNAGTNSKRPMAYRGKRIQHIFSKAEERELLSRVGDGYVWHENDTLLDYFLGRALCGDYPSEGDKPFWCFGEEGKAMPVNDMNRLFGRKNIGAIRRVRRMMPVPNGHELIDEVVDLTS